MIFTSQAIAQFFAKMRLRLRLRFLVILNVTSKKATCKLKLQRRRELSIKPSLIHVGLPRVTRDKKGPFWTLMKSMFKVNQLVSVDTINPPER